MFGLLDKEAGVPTKDDPAVQAAAKVVSTQQAEVERLEAEERRLLRAIQPSPNDPDPGETVREEAWQRLEVAKGTQTGYFLPELKSARETLKRAATELAARRAEAVSRLDTVRREARKPLIAEVLATLEAYVEAREALLAFDREWDTDRDTSHPVLERTTIEPIATRGQVEGLKEILDAQGWMG